MQLERQQNKLKNTRAVFTTRKNIAIIKTILKGKEERTAQQPAAASASTSNVVGANAVKAKAVKAAEEAKPAVKAEASEKKAEKKEARTVKK